MGVGEAYKGKEFGNKLGKCEVKDNPVGDGDRQQPIIQRYLLKEGAAKEDQDGEDQEGDEEESVSYNCNCGVTVMVFRCSMIL